MKKFLEILTITPVSRMMERRVTFYFIFLNTGEGRVIIPHVLFMLLILLKKTSFKKIEWGLNG